MKIKKKGLVVAVGVVVALAVVAPPATAELVRVTSVTGQPMVRDPETGLTWQGCAAGLSGDGCGTGSAQTMSWQAALAYCDALVWGGFDDWRLPNRNELQSIVDYDRYTPAIDPTAFPSTPSSWFWSSSSVAYNPFVAWGVYFGGGYVGSLSKGGAHRARCVRGRVGP